MSRLTLSNRIRNLSETILSNDWSLLKKVTFEYLRSDGQWQKQSREVYDRGDGVVILLYCPEQKTVVLTKQLRIPVFLNGHPDFLIEAAAGVLESGDSTDARIIAESEEETGYHISKVQKIFESYMSPGAVTEKLHFYIAPYDPGSKKSAGGGLAHEGEDIEVLELPFDRAFHMIETGEIADGKTIMLLQYAKIHLFSE